MNEQQSKAAPASMDAARVGTSLCDMHDGIAGVLPTYNVISYVRVEFDEPQVAHAWMLMVDAACITAGRRYLNKMLVVIGENSRGHVVAAYSYDNDHGGIVELDPK